MAQSSRSSSSPRRCRPRAVPGHRHRLRGGVARRQSGRHAVGRNPAGLGLSAVSPGRRLPASARGRQLGRRCSARHHRRHRAVSLHPQSDVSRPSHLHGRPRHHVPVLVRAGAVDRACGLVPRPRAEGRAAPRRALRWAVPRLLPAREALDPGACLSFSASTSPRAFPRTRRAPRRPHPTAASPRGFRSAPRTPARIEIAERLLAASAPWSARSRSGAFSSTWPTTRSPAAASSASGTTS